MLQLLALSLTVTAVASQFIDTQQCGVAYDCWQLENGAAIAWRKMADTPGWVDIQLMRPDSDRSLMQYVAIGFSADTTMGDDPVTECVFNGDQAEVHLSYNNDHSNKRIGDDLAKAHTKLIEARRSNGKLYCRLQQRINAPADVGGIYDINKPYYLLLATGTATATQINRHEYRVVRQQQVDVSAKEFPSAGSSDPVAAVLPGMPPHLPAANRTDALPTDAPLPTGAGPRVTPEPEPVRTTGAGAGFTGNSVAEPEPKATTQRPIVAQTTIRSNSIGGSAEPEPRKDGHRHTAVGSALLAGVVAIVMAI